MSCFHRDVSEGRPINTDLCENFENCPIFSGILKDKIMTTQAYQKQYCTAGEPGWTACRRYQVKARTGKCPPDLLPHSSMTVEQIMKESGYTSC